VSAPDAQSVESIIPPARLDPILVPAPIVPIAPPSDPVAAPVIDYSTY
jgi:hypothetical protein